MSLDLKEIEDIIKIHMGNQPYQIFCADCGDDLEVYQCIIDIDLDMKLAVYPCKCQK